MTRKFEGVNIQKWHLAGQLLALNINMDEAHLRLENLAVIAFIPKVDDQSDEKGPPLLGQLSCSP